MSNTSSKYSIEIVTPDGDLLADFAGRASNRRIIQSRNEAEEIQWSIDLNEYERYCRLLGQDSRALIIPNQTEVRIKRLNEYICGGQIVFANPKITPNSQVLSIRASGFLNLFKTRFTGTTSAGTVTETFTNTDKSEIAATLIEETQALTNGDYGVTIGTLATIANANRSYSRTNIKDAIQAFGNLQSGAFDHEFTYDKIFKTYATMGSNRPDIIFEYPKNIKEFEAPNDGTNTANQVTAFGSGFGEEAGVSVEVNDSGSQASYKLRQRFIQSNGTDDTDGGVTNAANSELAAWAFPYELPNVVIDGNISPFVTDYGIGDRVKMIVNGYKSLEHINGMYRIEKRIIEIDDMDSELVTLTVV